jgi:uncharacterized membrane protein
MTDGPVVMAVASYCSNAAAAADFRSLRDGGGHPARRLAIALVEKGAAGELILDRHYCTSGEPAWEGAVLGSALAVVAAPIGIRFLVPVVERGAVLGGVGAIAGHLWNNVPKDELRQMSDLLEAGQAALVVVTADEPREMVSARLSAATACVVAATVADLDRAYFAGVEEATAIG